MPLELLKKLAFLSHVFTKIPVFFCKYLVSPPLLPLYPSPRSAKISPPLETFLGAIFFETFFPYLVKNVCAHVYLSYINDQTVMSRNDT